MRVARFNMVAFPLFLGFLGCSSGTGSTASQGGANASGGATNTGGVIATGGQATGGVVATGGQATGGVVATGGKATGGAATGGTATGGAATGGTATGGAASGGSASGGTARDGGSTGGATVGGSIADGGVATDGSAGTGGTKADGGSGTGTAAVPSKGCGKADGLKTITAGGASVASGLATSTKLKITSGGTSREYILDVPADYNPANPYRLVFSWHQAYGSANGNAVGQYPAGNGPNFDAKNYAYFGLHRESTNAKQPAIFVAPGGIGNFPWDYTRDVALFDSLLALVGENLCIDESRVFTTGFSFGAMMSYALSVSRQSKLRAAVTMAAANYNLPGSPTPSTNGNVAYMGFTGMSDGTCPWVNSDSGKTGGKYCALQHAQVNGCTIPGTVQTTTVGSKKYVCYEFTGCKAGYPVTACTFDGAHTPSSIDDGSSTGDDGLKAFIPPLAWKFMAQF